MTSSRRFFAGIVVLTSLFLTCGERASAIPVFARKYGLPCSACHEGWPKLNTFGQTFKDMGYQLGNERDSPIYQNPAYWPVAMRITPHWHFESNGRTTIDNPDGVTTSEQTLKTSGFDLTGIDILAAGTLSNNISFLLVPSIDPGDGTVGFESANVRLDNLFGTPYLNFKFGKFEEDAPLSEKRILTLSNNGGYYQLYHFAPKGDTNDATLGENQLGIELSGHSTDDHTRYAASLVSSTNGDLGLPGGRTYDGYLHFSQAFNVPGLGLQRVGVYDYFGLRPTYFLTSGGEPIPGAGRGNRSFYRTGVYGTLYIKKFDLTAVYQRAGDNVYLANATQANQPLPTGARGAIWNTGTFEAHYTYSPQLILIGRYEAVRMAQQGLNTNPSDMNNVDVVTFGYRYYPIMNSRAGLAWHQEFSSYRSKLTSDLGAGQRNNSYFMGFDFAF